MKQPLVMSRPTDKNIRGGNDQAIMIIPELARATGMTDAMRADFRCVLMESVVIQRMLLNHRFYNSQDVEGHE